MSVLMADVLLTCCAMSLDVGMYETRPGYPTRKDISVIKMASSEEY